mgnify:CR=1 FL=1
MVNETMGNQSALSHEAGTRLVVAKEDFTKDVQETDIYAIFDPHYSGKCMMMRLNSSGAAPTGLYEEEVYSREFRVWDPMALLTDASSKSSGDMFYAIYNKDSKRWEVLQVAAVGSPRIFFEVVGYECISDTEVELTVTPIWYTGGCTATIPGFDSYDEGTVIDPCGKALFFAAADLIGKNGFATYMYPRTGYCTPRWLLDDLCGQPEC